MDTRPGALRWALAAVLGVLAAFQLALALGAPWGSAAWGGGYPGTLPVNLRVASAVSAVVWAWVALVTAGRFLRERGLRRVLLAIAVLSPLALAMNLATPSALERMIWAPISVVILLLSWTCWWQARQLTTGRG